MTPERVVLEQCRQHVIGAGKAKASQVDYVATHMAVERDAEAISQRCRCGRAAANYFWGTAELGVRACCKGCMFLSSSRHQHAVCEE